MRITIDEPKCCAAGQCVIAAPQVFDQRDEDGVVVLIDENPPETLRGDVERAARLCPTLAIRVE